MFSKKYSSYETSTNADCLLSKYPMLTIPISPISPISRIYSHYTCLHECLSTSSFLAQAAASLYLYPLECSAQCSQSGMNQNTMELAIGECSIQPGHWKFLSMSKLYYMPFLPTSVTRIDYKTGFHLKSDVWLSHISIWCRNRRHWRNSTRRRNSGMINTCIQCLIRNDICRSDKYSVSLFQCYYDWRGSSTARGCVASLFSL